jgi:hypothetical protein
MMKTWDKVPASGIPIQDAQIAGTLFNRTKVQTRD